MLFVFRLLSLLICIAVCVSTVNGQGQCPNGFIEQSSLPGLVNAAVTRPENYLYLFFSVNFTCQVEVSGFILLATEDDGVGEYPFIQIWREGTLTSNFYNRIHNIGSSDEVTFLGNSLYRYTSTSGNITVLPGDILGLLALSNSNSRVAPYLLNQSSPQYYEVILGGSGSTQLTQVLTNDQSNFRNQYLLLVAIELMNPFSSSSISSSILTTTTLTSVATSIITSTVYSSSYRSLTSTDYSALIMTSSSRMYFTTSTPSPSSPTTFSPILAGVIGGAIVAVVCIFVCLLMIAVHCVKKKGHYSEADGGATISLQTSSTMKIEQKNNPAYSTVTITRSNDPSYDSATEIQTNVAYASTSFDTMTDASYTEAGTYDIIQEENNDDYI